MTNQWFFIDGLGKKGRSCAALLVVAVLAGGGFASAQTPPAPPAAPAVAGVLAADQLDSLVAPIALYPDPLLSQVLVASTYPLEVIELKQWLAQNKNLKDKALADAVQQQHWDPSIQAMAGLPDVVSRLADNIKWTTDLGNAFLAQESDVMNAVQRLRKKAQDAGALKASEQQTVETKTVEDKTVVVIQPSNPQVVYVPTYNPVTIWGSPYYPYPPIYYPPPGYYAGGLAIAFGVGVAMGAFWSGGWGWNCGWGRNNSITINNNNNFINNSNRQNIANGNRSGNAGNGTWQHNPQHRGGAPYSNGDLANKFGGSTRGETPANRQANARSNQAGQAARQQPGGGSFGNSGSFGNAGGGQIAANRSLPSTPSAANSGAFGGAASRTSGNVAAASSARGASTARAAAPARASAPARGGRR